MDIFAETRKNHYQIMEKEYIIYEGNVLHACKGEGGRLYAALPVKMPDSSGKLRSVAVDVVTRKEGGAVLLCGTYGLRGAAYEFNRPVLRDAVPKEAGPALIGAGIFHQDSDGNLRFAEDACYAVNHLPQPRRSVDVALRVGRAAAGLAGLGALSVIAAPLLTATAALSVPVMTAGLFAAGFGVFEAVSSSRDVSRAREIGEMLSLQGRAMKSHHDMIKERIRSRVRAQKAASREITERKDVERDKAKARNAVRDYEKMKASTGAESKGIKR